MSKDIYVTNYYMRKLPNVCRDLYDLGIEYRDHYFGHSVRFIFDNEEDCLLAKLTVFKDIEYV